MARNIGIQLYTVREALKSDYKGVVAQIAKLGFKGVELAGDMGGMRPTELRAFLDGLGLHAVSGHIGLDSIVPDRWEQVLSDYQTLGAKYLGIAGVSNEWRTQEGVAKLIDAMNAAGRVSARHGITFFYHNHNFEFDTRYADGSSMFDALVAGLDPALVKFELDAYWAVYAQQDPVKVLERLSGRVALLHVKDMTKDDQRFFEIVGEGSMNFDAILPAADNAGVAWYLVEQDKCTLGEVESVTRSIANMRARGWM